MSFLRRRTTRKSKRPSLSGFSIKTMTLSSKTISEKSQRSARISTFLISLRLLIAFVLAFKSLMTCPRTSPLCLSKTFTSSILTWCQNQLTSSKPLGSSTSLSPLFHHSLKRPCLSCRPLSFCPVSKICPRLVSTYSTLTSNFHPKSKYFRHFTT